VYKCSVCEAFFFSLRFLVGKFKCLIVWSIPSKKFYRWGSTIVWVWREGENAESFWGEMLRPSNEVFRETGMCSKSEESFWFCTRRYPSNSVFSSVGAMTLTWTVSCPSSGVRCSPESGVMVHVPQVSEVILTVQFNKEPLSPMFCTWKLPLTVSPGFTFVQERLPEQSKSEELVCGGSSARNVHHLKHFVCSWYLPYYGADGVTSKVLPDSPSQIRVFPFMSRWAPERWLTKKLVGGFAV